MKTHRAIWAALLISLAFNAGVGLTLGVRAVHGRLGHVHHGSALAGGHVIEAFNLTPEQAAQFQAGHDRLFAALADAHQALTAETARLADLLVESQPDRPAVDVRLRRCEEMRREMQMVLVDHMVELRAMLDPDQQELFNAEVRRFLHHGPLGLHLRSHFRNEPQSDLNP